MDDVIVHISDNIAEEWKKLGLNLGVTWPKIKQIEHDNPRDIQGAILEMLQTWWLENEETEGGEKCLEDLKNALEKCDLKDVANGLDCIFKNPKPTPRKVNMKKEHTVKYKASMLLSKFAQRLQRYLRAYYIIAMAHLCINPMDPDDVMSVESMYVNLEFIQEDPDTTYFAVPLKDYSELFKTDTTDATKKRSVLRILVQGKAGAGKTSFTQKVAFDWTNESSEVLKRFENIFVLSMRNIQKGQSLAKAIKEQLFDENDDVKEVDLQLYIANNDKVLFILDGLDEMHDNTSQEITKIVNRQSLKYVCVLITCRPWKAFSLAQSGKKIDKHVRIIGFSKENKELFIAKFFSNLYKLSESSDEVKQITSSLLTKIEEHDLEEIAQIPLLLNMLCILFEDSKSMPNSVSEIYRNFRECLYERYLQKAGIEDSDEAKYSYIETLIKLGKLGSEGFLQNNPRLYFTQKEILDRVGLMAFEAGLISTEKAKAKIRANTQYHFLHKSFQENTSACYIANEMDRNQNDGPWNTLKKEIPDLKAIQDKSVLLQFCAGESAQLAEKILDFLEEKLFKIDPALETLIQTVKKMSREDECLTSSDLEVLTSTYDMTYDVKEMLDLQAKCLVNMHEPKQCALHFVYTFVADRCNVKKAFGIKALKPSHCIVDILRYEELESVVKDDLSLSWIHFKEEYSIEEKSVSCLSKICDTNQHPLSVYIDRSYCEPSPLADLIDILKKHKNIRYVYLDLQWNRFMKDHWEKIFASLMGITGLVGLCLEGCGLPESILPPLGQIISLNYQLLFVIDLAFNNDFQSHFNSIRDEIGAEKTLAVQELRLNACLDDTDREPVYQFLRQCPYLVALHVYNCEVEISDAVLALEHIKRLYVSFAVNTVSKEGMNMSKILANLHKFKKLERFLAQGCSIDDKQIETLKLDRLQRLKFIHLADNGLSLYVKTQLKQTCIQLGIDYVLDIKKEPFVGFRH